MSDHDCLFLHEYYESYINFFENLCFFIQLISIIEENINTLMHTWDNWHIDEKWVKYVEMYIQKPANSMSNHIYETILVRSCGDCVTFV